jgi:hypothetical protein
LNNKVVARFADGRTVKGTTMDFHPDKNVFHVIEAGNAGYAPPIPIHMRELKAVFFVKDLVGDPHRSKTVEPGPGRPAAGRTIKVVFSDGEVLVGTTADFHHGRPGFFVEPIDPSVNEQRCYVLAAATREITFP